MGLAELLALISGIVKFLPEIRKLVLILEKSPAERANHISKLITEESERLRLTGRPTWEE